MPEKKAGTAVRLFRLSRSIRSAGNQEKPPQLPNRLPGIGVLVDGAVGAAGHRTGTGSW